MGIDGSFDPAEVIAYSDAKIRILPQSSQKRRVKTTRYAVVVQHPEASQKPSWATLLVCPIHSDHDATTPWDVALPKLTLPRLNADSWIMIPSIQPIEKKYVKARMGQIPMDIYIKVLDSLANFTSIYWYLDND